MTFPEAIERLRDTQISPGELSQILIWLSGEYAYTSSLLEQILAFKADKWMEMRDKETSDKQADKKWDATADGKLEMSYRLKLKSAEKMMSAIRTRLRHMELEARNFV